MPTYPSDLADEEWRLIRPPGVPLPDDEVTILPWTVCRYRPGGTFFHPVSVKRISSSDPSRALSLVNQTMPVASYPLSSIPVPEIGYPSLTVESLILCN